MLVEKLKVRLFANVGLNHSENISSNKFNWLHNTFGVHFGLANVL